LRGRQVGSDAPFATPDDLDGEIALRGWCRCSRATPKCCAFQRCDALRRWQALARPLLQPHSEFQRCDALQCWPAPV
jgi:hypothetical protein